eukprot:1679709-Amphidinium_carterae.1
MYAGGVDSTQLASHGTKLRDVAEERKVELNAHFAPSRLPETRRFSCSLTVILGNVTGITFRFSPKLALVMELDLNCTTPQADPAHGAKEFGSLGLYADCQACVHMQGQWKSTGNTRAQTQVKNQQSGNDLLHSEIQRRFQTRTQTFLYIFCAVSGSDLARFRK